MVRTTAVLLIVQTFSTAAFSADERRENHCQCESSGEVVVALSSPLVSLEAESGQLASQNKAEDSEKFAWTPVTTEKKWIYVVMHHSATESGSVESIHTSHRQRKDSLGNPWLGIGYHFVIGNGSGMLDGEVESTFRWKQQVHGAHSGSLVHNASGIGICLIGNFQQHPPTGKQLKAVTQLVSQLSQRYNIPARLVIGHKTVKPTACPGRFFPLQDVVRDSVPNGTSNASLN